MFLAPFCNQIMNNQKCCIIAEAGVNHNGQEGLAFKLIDAAAEAGADIVKFQTYKTENIIAKGAAKASYQSKTTDSNESQYEMLKQLELPFELHHKLQAYCDEKNIQFLSTAFDGESLAFLVNDLGLKTLKIPSGEITNSPLLLEHALTGANLILSTGMCRLDEIEEALGVIAFGLTKKTTPSVKAFKDAYASKEGQDALRNNVTLLHCTTEYPAPLEEVNLRAMETMRQTFHLPVGYSDHTEGITTSIAATALGAVIIEKHFTLDKTLPGPDHQASLEPSELQEMVKAIRSVEKVLGNGKKTPAPSEIKNISIARKSLVAKETIKQGDIFSEKNLGIKRPGNGLSPMHYWDLLGKKVDRDYQTDEVIQ